MTRRLVAITLDNLEDLLDTASLASLKQHILGQWLYCSGPLLFARQHDGKLFRFRFSLR